VISNANGVLMNYGYTGVSWAKEKWTKINNALPNKRSNNFFIVIYLLDLFSKWW